MLAINQKVSVLAGGLVSTALSMLASKTPPATQPARPRLYDLAMGVTVVMWLLYLLVTESRHLAISSPLAGQALSAYAAYAAHLFYQLSIIGIAFVLLACAGITQLRFCLILAAQAVVGIAVLDWYQSYGAYADDLSNKASQAWAYEVWATVNLATAVWLTVVVATRMHGINSPRGWLVLAGCLAGFGLGLNHVLVMSQFGTHATVSDYLYAICVVVIWYLVTRKFASVSSLAGPASDFQSSSVFGPDTDYGPIQNEVALALALERHRISQDLHDGVGSQIVGILSSLENSAPEQQHLVLALEQCLIDLKMTVDALDGADENIVEALGGLRYRFQHTLDRLNINMIWNLEPCRQLEEVRGVESQQALRIAQECLANVIRHAQASIVEVACMFDPQTNHMILDVRDNGKGIAYIPEGTHTGKGLQGMRQRAHHMGGKLMISSKTGAGTCVRLILPLRSTLA